MNSKDKSRNLLEHFKSIPSLKRILNNLTKKKSLEIIKSNKKIQQKLNININLINIFHK